MIYVILGPTASGKTTLATKIAKEYNLPLVGADAFQLYQELDIGVAKPTKEELEGLVYHLIDEIPLTTEMNVRIYQEKVRELLDKYEREGKDVILSGGTFLYVRAALYPYEFPEIEVEAKDYSSYSNEALFNMVLEKDPEAASTLHPNNRRRVEQAMRIIDSGVKKSDLMMKDIKPLYPVKIFAIEVKPEIGNAKIDKRVDEMMKAGLIEEVKEFIARGVTSLRPFQAIGYKEVVSGLNEGKSTEEIALDIKLNTRHYAKRQRTFLRHQFPGIISGSAEEIYDLIVADLALKTRTKLALGARIATKLESLKCLIVGIGGVGGSLFEGLVRMGAKDITIIDDDKVELSNLNRQTLYDLNDIGKLKVEAAKGHVHEISRLVEITSIPSRIVPDYFKDATKYDVIFDCIDDVKGKVEIARYALDSGSTLIVATGSGLRKDASKVTIGTLDDTGEPLAKAYKKALKEAGIDYTDIVAVYSKEVPLKRTSETLGSIHLVPNTFGLVMLSALVTRLEKEEK